MPFATSSDRIASSVAARREPEVRSSSSSSQSTYPFAFPDSTSPLHSFGGVWQSVDLLFPAVA